MNCINAKSTTYTVQTWDNQERVHYLVWCSEHGRVSVWASYKVAEPQRNWHELQHLEGVMGKHTVVQVHVIVE